MINTNSPTMKDQVTSRLITTTVVLVLWSTRISMARQNTSLLLCAAKLIFSPTFTGQFQTDEIITQSRTVGGQQVTARGRVISWNNITKVLKYYQNRIDGVFLRLLVTSQSLKVVTLNRFYLRYISNPDINFLLCRVFLLVLSTTLVRSWYVVHQWLC